jgi:hypothetical protein
MKPFRWSISKREQLGSLLDDVPSVNLKKNGFLDDLRQASARIVAMADTADLAFIGRTPESCFDYLSGLFAGLDDAPSLHLVHFSLRWAGPEGLQSIGEAKRAAFMDYLIDEGVDAASVSTGSRSLALVDFIVEGGTMENFVRILQMQAGRDGVDWNGVQRRLKIIGLRTRTHNSPNTWRWQQHQDWLDIIPDTVIKNVSAPWNFLYFIGNFQPKVTHAHQPDHWDRAATDKQPPTEAQLLALRRAVKLYDLGQTRDERRLFAGLLAASQEMRQSATRALVSRLKGL